jgi:hypothetical protein
MMSNSRDKLILLADELDRKGLTSEASVVDDIISDHVFNEETRGDVTRVVESMKQYIAELSAAASNLGEQEGLNNLFLDKLEKLSEATSFLLELDSLKEMDRDGDLPEEKVTEEVVPDTIDDFESEGKQWWESSEA